MKRPLKLDRLRASQGQVRITPVRSLEETLVPLQDDVEYWGFYTTPSKAEMSHWAGEEWRREVGKLPMQEVRVFGAGLDLHWWEGSGTVLLEAGGSAHREDGQGSMGLGGEGWLERDRRSRLWGEWLEGGNTWYEERIPRQLEYPGLEPGLGHRFPFLYYRDYIRAGVVEFVRYLSVQGGA